MVRNILFDILKNCYQLSILIILISIIVRPVAMATEFSQVELEDSDFLLLNVTLQQKRLLESIEAYQSEDQVLLPVSLFISALGSGVEVNLADNTLLYTTEGNTIVIELSKGITSTPLPDGQYYWAKDNFELYLSHQILASLLKASINIQLTRLNVVIKSLDELFPIEKSWLRADQLKKSEEQESKKILYVADTYQLLTPPSADIALSLGQHSESGFSGAFSLQSYSDVLYHSTNISLHKSLIDDEITSRVEFTRHQSSPDTPLWGGLNEYSFGDIYSGGNTLYSHSASGLGFKFSRKPDGVSNSFGTQNIEGNATPGWEVELHYNGFLIETQRVPDNGHYVFQNVTTDYGNNHFEVRLFGPFGEEEVRRVNINIGSNWLPKGEFSYTGYMLNANKTLISGDVDRVISDAKEDYGFAVDYSPFDNTHMGYFYQHVASKTIITTPQESRAYMGTHIQSALNNLLLDIEYVQQQDRGHRLTAQGIGQFPSGQNYNVVLQEQRDFSLVSNTLAPYNYQASFSTSGILPFKRGVGHRTGITYTGGEDSGDSLLLNSSLSWRFSSLHFSESLNYRVNNLDNIVFKDNILTGNFTVTSNISDVRLRTTANYFIQPTSYLASISLGASLRASQNSFHNLNANYLPESEFRKEDKWNVGYTYSITLEKLRLFSNLDMNSENEWLAGLGVNFFFDYDAHNDEFLMNSVSTANAGHLNVTSYLDRNDNNRRDEGDWLLENVGFSPLPSWRNRVTNKSGQVTLSGVPVYNPVTFSANPEIDVATKQPTYTIYTHPGSRVNIELPFTIKTNIIGFVEIEGTNGQQVLTTGTMILINQNTDEQTELLIDIDGFYETPALNTGHYSLQISDKDLKRLNFKSKQGIVNFVTPAQGGDYEMPVISLLPSASTSTTQEATTVILNEENGEAFYFGDDIESTNIYVNPWEPRVGINGGSSPKALTSAPNYKTDSTQPLDSPVSDSSSNEAMISESRSGVATNPVMVRPPSPIASDVALHAEGPNSLAINLAVIQQPSSIASDEALRAEAAGNFSEVSNQVENLATQAQPQQPLPQQIANNNNVQPRQYYTLQVGAFSTSVNAGRWLQSNETIAAACSVSKPATFYIIDCGYFNVRSVAVDYQQQLAQQHNIKSSLIKTVDTPRNDSNITEQKNSLIYTIQLLAAAQKSTLDDFIILHNLNIVNIHIKDKVVNGRTLKVLSYGSYASKNDAQQAISVLPTKIQQQTWITPL